MSDNNFWTHMHRVEGKGISLIGCSSTDTMIVYLPHNEEKDGIFDGKTALLLSGQDMGKLSNKLKDNKKFNFEAGEKGFEISATVSQENGLIHFEVTEKTKGGKQKFINLTRTMSDEMSQLFLGFSKECGMRLKWEKRYGMA